MSSNDFDIQVEGPGHEEGKLHRLLEGPVRMFPGNASMSQFFSAGLTDGRIVPDRLAVKHHEKVHTFVELEEVSDSIAVMLRDLVKGTKNVNPDGDSVIGVCIPPSNKLIFILFAIYKLGAAYVPIDVSFPEERVIKIARDCKPLLMISHHHSNYASKFENVKVKLLTTKEIMHKLYGNDYEDLEDLDMFPEELEDAEEGEDEDEDDEEEEEQEEVEPELDDDDDDENEDEEEEEEEMQSNEPEVFAPLPGHPSLSERTALILYTSGSSGEPKGVRLSHRTAMNRLSWQWNEFPFTPDEVCVFKTSLTFVDSVAEIFAPLLQGIPLVIFDKTITSQPSVLMEKLNYHKITRVTLVPSLLRAIFQTFNVIGRSNASRLNCVKLWISSGEPLTYDLLAEFFELYPRKHTLANFYGSTELMGDVTYVTYFSREEAYKKVVEKRVPIGIPVYNTVIYVLDQEMNMSENGEIGEIYVAGYNLATNYVGGSSADKFIENMYTRTTAFRTMYRTGDFGRIELTQDGTRMLFYEGRVDSQIKVRGQRVDLAEIELALSDIHLVSKVVVLCHHPGEADQTIIAYVTPVEPLVTLDRLQPMIAKRLRDYERPVVRLIEQIPTLVNGKTDRQRLLKMFAKEMEMREEFEDWHILKLPDDKLKIAKITLKVMSQVTGSAVEMLAENIDNSFFNVGGTSLNAVVVVIKLRQHGGYISVADFASAKSIRDVVNTIFYEEKELLGDEESFSGEHAGESQDLGAGEGRGIMAPPTRPPILKKEEPPAGESQLKMRMESYKSRYDITTLVHEDQEDVIHTIAYSFSKKGDLEQYTKATYDDFREMMEFIWMDILNKGYSFIVRRPEDHKCVGVSLNFDVYDEPENVQCSKAIHYTLDMLEFIESRQRFKLPRGRGKLLHSFMMGTHEEVDEAESVAVIEEMEEHILRMATERKFMGVMTTNTNALTKQIDLDLHNFEVLNEYQINRYVAPDGTKPFLLAPDSFTIVCCWKQIPGNQMDMF